MFTRKVGADFITDDARARPPTTLEAMTR